MKGLKLGLVVCCLVLILALLPLASACPGKEAEAKTLKIGMITSITGPMSVSFKSIYDAAKPTADLLNEMGGITVNGQQYNIEIVTEDDMSSPDGAVAAANLLIQDGIKFIIAPQFIAANMAIAGICEEAKVIRIQAMSVDLSQYGPENYYAFDACMTLYWIPPAYDYLAENYPQMKKMAIIMADDPGGVAPNNITVQEAEKRGIETVFNEVFMIGTEDFYPIVTKALAENPDGIEFVLGFVPWAAGIIGAARDMGFTGPAFCGSPLGDINWLNSMVDPAYAYDIFAAGPNVLSPKMLPIVKDHRARVEEVTGGYNMDNVLPLVAAWPLLQAIEKAQSFDTDKVVDTWANMQSLETAFGTSRMAGEELVGVNRFIVGPVPMGRIMNGEIEFEFLPAE